MHPVLFELPGLGFPIRSFGVLVATGFLVGIHIWARILARHGAQPEADPERSARVALWVLAGIMVGARLMYVVVEVSKHLAHGEAGSLASAGARFLDDPLSIFFVWQGGLVMYGGMFGGILFGLIRCQTERLHPWRALDTGLVAAFVGQAIGRIGCLLVGDDHGRLASEGAAALPFPFTIRVPDLKWLQANPESLFDRSLAGEVVYATQIWMSLNALVIAGVGLALLRRGFRPGCISAWILFHYCVTRFAIEHFRGDTVRGLWFDGALSTSQLIAIPGAALGLFVFLRMRGMAAEPQRQ